MKLARTLMVQGTASSVGKSVLVAALCRIFHRAGVSVAPFKAQNMSLNAAVTADGLEIGRAQAVQAEAAGLAPRVEMNPILLKPEGDQRSQLVLMGRAAGHVSARSYYEDDRAPLKDAIERSLSTLRREHELVIIEGAGSPAEVNLKARDLVNMHVAKLADAPVLLIGDIDRGGVFAALLGTLDLLDRDERARVAGLIVNKFRGDPSLFKQGMDFLEARSGKPVLGVIPFVPRLAIADEDSHGLEQRARERAGDDKPGESLQIAVVRLPRMSNHDDVLSLERAPGVRLRFVDRSSDAHEADLVIVPGSKSTIADLTWLRAEGFDRVLLERAQRGQPVLGVCGGCQMLGQAIEDPTGVEASMARVAGLGLLPIVTRFVATKTTAQVQATLRAAAPSCFLTARLGPADRLSGYEIHHGQVAASNPEHSLFAVTRRGQGDAVDGATDATGQVVGTMLHGLLDNASLRAGMLAHLWARRGRADATVSPHGSGGAELDRLADHVAAALDMTAVRRIAGFAR